MALDACACIRSDACGRTRQFACLYSFVHTPTSAHAQAHTRAYSLVRVLSRGSAVLRMRTSPFAPAHPSFDASRDRARRAEHHASRCEVERCQPHCPTYFGHRPTKVQLATPVPIRNPTRGSRSRPQPDRHLKPISSTPSTPLPICLKLILEYLFAPHSATTLRSY
eukprot:910792-Pleurochrysis_carterae.AAC.1